MNQQRARRFKSAQEAQEKEEKAPRCRIKPGSGRNSKDRGAAVCVLPCNWGGDQPEVHKGAALQKPQKNDADR